LSLRERLGRKPPGYQFTVGRILAIYSGLMVTLLLAALDQTIVATALPKVVSDLGGITQYSWVFTAYMLGSTVTVPLYGKLGDVHGRKPLFIVAITIFLVGSALCGAAQNMWELVVAGRTRWSGPSSSASASSFCGRWTPKRRTARRHATWSSPGSGSG
jgi:MFS family permease